MKRKHGRKIKEGERSSGKGGDAMTTGHLPAQAPSEQILAVAPTAFQPTTDLEVSCQPLRARPQPCDTILEPRRSDDNLDNLPSLLFVVAVREKDNVLIRSGIDH